jgi:hypothetical protein
MLGAADLPEDPREQLSCRHQTPTAAPRLRPSLQLQGYDCRLWREIQKTRPFSPMYIDVAMPSLVITSRISLALASLRLPEVD